MPTTPLTPTRGATTTIALALGAACAAPPPLLANHAPAGADDGADLQRRVAFAPGGRGDHLGPYDVPLDRAKALLATLGDRAPSLEAGAALGGEPSPAPYAYDLDRDGVADLIAIPTVMYGPSQGWDVYLRARDAIGRDTLDLAFAISGDFAEARDAGDQVILRFEANTLAPGEARFSTTLRYDRRHHGWSPAVSSYGALQAVIPQATAPLIAFTTRGPVSLRAAPSISDEPNPPDAGDDFERTRTLRGNLLASVPAGAHGVVVGRDRTGGWRYVAFDPASPPDATSLGHGMGGEGDSWLCGWVLATDLGGQ
jgi:hypothetical protein